MAGEEAATLRGESWPRTATWFRCGKEKTGRGVEATGEEVVERQEHRGTGEQGLWLDSEGRREDRVHIDGKIHLPDRKPLYSNRMPWAVIQKSSSISTHPLYSTHEQKSTVAAGLVPRPPVSGPAFLTPRTGTVVFIRPISRKNTTGVNNKAFCTYIAFRSCANPEVVLALDAPGAPVARINVAFSIVQSSMICLLGYLLVSTTTSKA